MELFNKWKSEKCPRCGGKLEAVSSAGGRETKRCTSCGEHNYQEVSTFGEGIGGSMTNKALYGQAAILVDEYNKAAGALAEIVGRVWELRKKLNDNNGNIIISGDSWRSNALSCIPMLKMEGGSFPVVPPAGKFYQAGAADDVFIRLETFSEVKQPDEHNNPDQKGKSMNNRVVDLLTLAKPTGANSTIVYDNIRLVLNNCLEAVAAIKANKELKEEAVKKRLSDLYANALSTLEGYYVMSNACLTQAKSIVQSTINANSQNMGAQSVLSGQ